MMNRSKRSTACLVTQSLNLGSVSSKPFKLPQTKRWNLAVCLTQGTEFKKVWYRCTCAHTGEVHPF
jgi:hypothetical protein